MDQTTHHQSQSQITTLTLVKKTNAASGGVLNPGKNKEDKRSKLPLVNIVSCCAAVGALPKTA